MTEQELLAVIDPVRLSHAVMRHTRLLGHVTHANLHVDIVPLVMDLGIDPTPAHCQVVVELIYIALSEAQAEAISLRHVSDDVIRH